MVVVLIIAILIAIAIPQFPWCSYAVRRTVRRSQASGNALTAAKTATTTRARTRGDQTRKRISDDRAEPVVP